MRLRSRLATSVWWVSARPISHGDPACLIEVSGEAPVPPSKPAMVTWSARAFDDAGGDGADADLGHELHRHVAGRIDVLEVEDELRQVLDRIDVVVRRRRDQADARRRVAHLGDRLVDLVAGKLAAFAGLRALRHLDLHDVGIDEVFRGHAEPAGGDLLDRRTHGIAVRQRLVAVRFLATLAGVRLAADAVHRDRERGVGLARDRAVGHGAGREAAHDARRRLDLLERHRLAAVLFGGLDGEHAADGEQALGLLVAHLGIGAILVERIAAHRVLQRADRRRRPHVILAAHPVGIFAADVERVLVDRGVAEGVAVTAHRLLRDLVEADALDAGRGAGEEGLDEIRAQPDRVENLRAAIGLIGRDAHLGHHLEQPLVDRLDVALDDFLLVELLRQLVLHRDQRLEGEIGIDRLGAVAGEAGEVVHFARLAGFDHEADRGAQALADQVVMDRGAGEQRRDRNAVRAGIAVRQDDDVDAVAHRLFGLVAQEVDRLRQALARRDRRPRWRRACAT